MTPDDLQHYDPDAYRMSLGDHLEELRKRIILGLIGLAVGFGVCAAWGREVIQIFCRPLIDVLVEKNINPQLYFTSAGDAFTVYLKITMICGAIVASPWIVWQLWLFIAAGLYPRERKAMWRYAPVSIGLLLAGVAFCFWVVLPLVLRFFIEFGEQIPLDLWSTLPDAATTLPAASTVPAIAGDPAALQPYQIWFDTLQQRLKFSPPNAEGVPQIMVIPFGPQSLVSPMIMLPDYIDMVLKWLLIFGVAFQLPLVTMAVARLGLVDVASLKRFRRYAYVGLAVVSSMLMPDVFSGTLMLLVPLWLLYELGIFLARDPRGKSGES